MLSRLEISDFALIEHASVDFGAGFTILTGETGAGKSILIDAIGAVCGSRVTRDMVRSDKESSVISAVFDDFSGKIPSETLEEYGISPEEDTLFLTREIYANGKSFARVNGRMVPAGALRSLTAYLLDIHGQHENQSIFREEMQLLLLDRFGSGEIRALLGVYRDTLSEYLRIDKELKGYETDTGKKQQLADLLEYQIAEIRAAAPRAGEDAILSERRKILANSEKILLAFEKALFLLNGEAAEMPALPAVKEASRQISVQLSAFEGYTPLSESLDEISYRIEDVCEAIQREIGMVDVDPGEVKKIDDRLDVLYNLKHKYGGSIESAERHLEKAQQQLDHLRNSETRVKFLLEQKSDVLGRLAADSFRLYEARCRTAEILEKEITGQLAELGMRGTAFSVRITHGTGEKDYGPDGRDKLEFLISPNVGEELRPLSRIASGGEASRIMLAVKTILADSDSIPVLIFDEIDTGISGRTAGLLGEKLLRIAESHQVFCVTHMAQIAAKARNHIRIEKTIRGGRTFTDIRYVTDQDRVREIARLLSGDENKGEAVELARVMLS